MVLYLQSESYPVALAHMCPHVCSLIVTYSSQLLLDPLPHGYLFSPHGPSTFFLWDLPLGSEVQPSYLLCPAIGSSALS